MGSTGKHIESHEPSAGRQPGADRSRGDNRLPRHTSHPVTPATPKQTPNPKKPTRADYATDVIYAMDDKGGITMVNRAISTLGYTQEELIGHFFLEFIYKDDRNRMARAYIGALANRQTRAQSLQFRVLTKTGEIRWLEANAIIAFDPQGQFIMHEGMCRDITDNFQGDRPSATISEGQDANTQEAGDDSLPAGNEWLRGMDSPAKIRGRKRDREKSLEMEKANLQEANTALKVLLKRRELDKRALEEQVMFNISRMVLPYLKKIAKESTDSRHKDYVSIIESNLNDITGNFSRRLSLGFYGLSAAELKVANFIRQGKNTRQIAQLLGLSPRTIDTYRHSIRSKLHIKNKNVNLRTFLMSIK